MSILSGLEIVRQVELGNIRIDPFQREHVNPASVDLTLGTKVAQYIDSNFEVEDFTLMHLGKQQVPVHNVKKKPKVSVFEMDESGYVLWPDQLYLMHTVERVYTKNLVPVLDGKSSIGRLGVQVHLTAGFGDPGFDGQYTLEVVTFRAVRLYAGMRICQMRFHELVGEVESYQKRGHYRGKTAHGPVPSMVHKQFEEK